MATDKEAPVFTLIIPDGPVFGMVSGTISLGILQSLFGSDKFLVRNTDGVMVHDVDYILQSGKTYTLVDKNHDISSLAGTCTFKFPDGTVEKIVVGTMTLKTVQEHYGSDKYLLY